MYLGIVQTLSKKKLNIRFDFKPGEYMLRQLAFKIEKYDLV